MNQALLPPLLSDEYRELNAELHRREPTYGTTGRRYVDLVRGLARKFNARHVLDYGCGKCDLSAALQSEFEIRNFDPALPGLDARPDPADVVACIDVLEHVEPEYLDNVLTDLKRLTLRAALFTIATRPALKLLADGLREVTKTAEVESNCLLLRSPNLRFRERPVRSIKSEWLDRMISFEKTVVRVAIPSSSRISVLIGTTKASTIRSFNLIHRSENQLATLSAASVLATSSSTTIQPSSTHIPRHSMPYSTRFSCD